MTTVRLFFFVIGRVLTRLAKRREASIYTIFMSIRDVTPFPAFLLLQGKHFLQGAMIYFLLDDSWVGPIRFGNPLPTVLPMCPDLQN